MKIVDTKTTTLVELDVPARVEMFGGALVEVLQVKYTEYMGGDTEVKFGGYRLNKDGSRHAAIPFRFYLGTDAEDARAVEWLRELRG